MANFRIFETDQFIEDLSADFKGRREKIRDKHIKGVGRRYTFHKACPIMSLNRDGDEVSKSIGKTDLRKGINRRLIWGLKKEGDYLVVLREDNSSFIFFRLVFTVLCNLWNTYNFKQVNLFEKRLKIF